jgi:hypothetical protein
VRRARAAQRQTPLEAAQLEIQLIGALGDDRVFAHGPVDQTLGVYDPQGRHDAPDVAPKHPSWTGRRKHA